MPRPSDPLARPKLLAAAEALFVARGVDETKVEDIAARAGLGKGSFYLHFPNKEAAFRELVEGLLVGIGQQLEALPEEVPAPDSDVEEFLAGRLAYDLVIFDYVWANRGLVGLLLYGGRSSAFHHLVDGFCDRAEAKTRRVLKNGIASGFYRPDLDVDVAAPFIAGAYDRLARQIVREPRRPKLEVLLSRAMHMVLWATGSARVRAALERLPVDITPTRPSAARSAAAPVATKARKRAPR